jgi:hypothetical protein
MPQIDFGRAFSDPEKLAAPPSQGEASPPSHAAQEVVDLRAQAKAVWFRCPSLGRSEWANIIFTIVAVAGGLFGAFYFFNGTDLLRTASRWPQENLFPRSGVNDDAARYRLAEALGLPALPDLRHNSRNSRDVFSRASGLLSLQPQNSSDVAAPASPTNSDGPSRFAGSPGNSTPGSPGSNSPLSGLGQPAPGGNNFGRSFDNAASDLQRASRLEAKRTVVVLHDKVTRMEKRLSRQSKAAARYAGRTTSNASGRTRAHGHFPGASMGTNGVAMLSAASSGKSVSSATSSGSGSGSETRGGGLRGLARSGVGSGGLGGGMGGRGGSHGRGHR